MTFDDLGPGDFQPTSIEGGLPKLVRIWEHLRELNWGGYGGAVLVDVKGAVSKGKSGVTSCSPFTATSIYMALDPRPFDPGQPWSAKEPYEPLFDGGKPLDVNFYRLHNGFSLSSYASVKDKKFAGWKADFKQRYVDRMPQLANDFSAFNFINHSAGSVIALNLGQRVDRKRMRRGDMVGIDWHNGNGHATFCWNVHLDKNGDVDCFQFISSNGTSANGGAGITIFRYPDVDPTYLEKSGGKYTKKKDMFSKVIDDPRAYPEYIQKPYWWFGLPGVKKGDIELDTFGVPPRTVQISYADSMDVSVHVVHVARLHGVTPPEPYLRADDGKTPESQKTSKPPALTKAKSKKVDDAAPAAQSQPEKAPPGVPHPVQADVEANLAILWTTRWISKNPGDPKSINDAQSQAALRDYQEKFMRGDVPQLGHPDPKTRQRLAHTAAVALAMPMVNAALQIAHQHGEIQAAPGENAMQLDDATRAAVKEFQKKKGLEADGIPGQNTQVHLSAYMKEAARSQPAQTKGAPQHKDSKAGDVPALILFLYFARNHGPARKPVTLCAVATPACNGQRYSIRLFQGEQELVKNAGEIRIADCKGSLELEIPEDAAAGSLLVAKLSGGGLAAQTAAPFYVDPSWSSPVFEGLPWVDGHGSAKRKLQDFDTSRQLSPQIAFGSKEHFELGDVGLQPMIDAWARAGLIGGGAFIEDTGQFEDPDPIDAPLLADYWKISVPDYSNPTAPYGRDFQVGSRAHWQWIVPNANYDSNGRRWTAATLREEVIAGKAVTLSIGDIVMMSGDLVEYFEDFKKARSPGWRPGPVNMMKGLEQLEPFAMTGVRLGQFPRSGAQKLEDLDLLERCKRDYAGMQAEVRRKSRDWIGTKGIIEFLKTARGGPTASGCSELLVLSRILRNETPTVTALRRNAPWLKQTDLRDAMNSGLGNDADASDMTVADFLPQKLQKDGFNLEILQLIISNGHYGALGLRNVAHFTPHNWEAFEMAHRAALKMVDDVVLNPAPRPELAPIPADAIARTAYGMHFMTDAFASGHMRTPRKALGQRGAFLAKVMHDIDNKVGLWVKDGFGDVWRAFGDGFLDERGEFQKDLVARLPNPDGHDTARDANVRRITAAIAAAMKQIHYQAQKYLGHPNAKRFQAVLTAIRGDSSSLFLDGYAPHGSPGTPGVGRDKWIDMDIPAKLSFLRNHQPRPLPSAGALGNSAWLAKPGYNISELLLDDGSISSQGGYTWESHASALHKDRIVQHVSIGDIKDFTDFYHVVLNMPPGAEDWYGPSEQGLLTLFDELPERK